MKIETVLTVPTESAYFSDDQAAIRAGATQDGFLYVGAPVSPGFTSIRQPGAAAAILLVLSDGYVAHGDSAVVQYSGVAGRAALFQPEAIAAAIHVIEADLIGADLQDFAGLMHWIEQRDLFPEAVARAAAYGLSQALLDACAHARGVLMAHVLQDYLGHRAALREVPVFTQSGDDRRAGVDRMVLKQADFLPHGLFNDVQSKFGHKGELFLDYVTWLHDRVETIAPAAAYRPTFHLDIYGCAGDAFSRDTILMANFFDRVTAAAHPYRLRIEHPLDAGNRASQISEMRALRLALRDRELPVELVADEWCNTLDDIGAFIEAGAADVIHVKTPDLGSVANAATALWAVKTAGFVGYCGGTCNETERSAQISAHIAMAADADEVLAKPGMGVDEGLMIVRNEMKRAVALDRVLRPARDGGDDR